MHRDDRREHPCQQTDEGSQATTFALVVDHIKHCCGCGDWLRLPDHVSACFVDDCDADAVAGW